MTTEVIAVRAPGPVELTVTYGRRGAGALRRVRRRLFRNEALVRRLRVPEGGLGVQLEGQPGVCVKDRKVAVKAGTGRMNGCPGVAATGDCDG